MENTTPYSMTSYHHSGGIMLVLAVLIGGGFYIFGKNMDYRHQTPANITVTGDSKVSASPDIALMTFGVQTGRQASAKVALDMLSKKMNAILAEVKKLGIDDKDIKSDQFSMSPSYDWTSGTQRLVGYEASQTFAVKVRDLDKVGDLLTAATNAGANQAGDVNFTIDNPDSVQAQARGQAIEKAKAKALVLAQQLGLHLGKVTSFTEGGGYVPPVPMYMARDAMPAGVMNEKALPMPSGQLDVNEQVTITYELN